MGKTLHDIDQQPGAVWKNEQCGIVLPLKWFWPLRPVGDGDPYAKLLGRIDIGDASFHIEAWEVEEVEDAYPEYPGQTFQRAKEPDDNWYELIAEHMTEGAGQTVKINGRDYFIVMTPYQE